MTRINFQETSLVGMDFTGANLAEAKFTGCDLKNANFTDANLTGTQFDFAEVALPDEDIGADGDQKGAIFTGANLLGSNIKVAQAWWNATDIPDDLEDVGEADTHNVFYKMDLAALVRFFKNLGLTGSGSLDTKAMFEYIKEFYIPVIERMTDPRDIDIRKRYLDVFKPGGCFAERLIGPTPFNFRQVLLADETPPVSFGLMVRYATEYAKRQSLEFQDTYVQSVIRDSLEGHAADAPSCPRGIIERMVTYLKDPAFVEVEKFTGEIQKHNDVLEDPSKSPSQKTTARKYITDKEKLILEYKDLIDIISSDPEGLVRLYQQEWLQEHAPDKGEAAFAKEPTPGGSQELLRTPEELMENYLTFLKKKFKLQHTFDHPKNKFLKKTILDNPRVGVVILGQLAEAEMLNFGGGRKKNRHTKKRKYRKNKYYKHHKSRKH